MDAARTQHIAGRYRIVRTIASGGMGSVLLAEDERLGRMIAIKRMHAEGGEDSLQRFRREARLGASLSHPNLVAIYDAIVDEPDVMILMEYVPGRSLAEALRRGPLDRAAAGAILRDVAAGLDHAHEHGVLHRDVKPGNILLADAGPAKLGDLGIATAVESTQITVTGSVMGTAAYLAPERIEGAPASAACDIYALAAVAYEMLAGRRARAGRTPAEIVRRAAVEPPPDLREVDPSIPAPVAEAIRRGLDADPTRRPPTAGALAAGIVEHLDAEREPEPEPERLPEPEPEPPTLVTPPPPPLRPKRPRSAEPRPAPRRRAAAAPAPAPASPSGRRLAPVGAALAALLAIAIGAAVLLGGGDDDPAGERAAATPEATPTATATPRAEEEEQAPPATAEPESGSGATTAAAPRRGPATGVSGFYENIAAERWAAAWAHAAPDWRAKWGNDQETFSSDRNLRSLESITFPTLKVTDRSGNQATVAFSSRAKHPDRTDRCDGTVTVTRGADGTWQMGAPDMSCGTA